MRYRFLCSSLLSLGVVVGLPALAAAKCAMPNPGLAPAAGKVPQNPVLWLFVPTWENRDSAPLPKLRVTANKTRVPVHVKVDTKAENLHTFRIELTTKAAGPITVDLLGDTGEVKRSWSLEVDPAWQAPVRQTAQVTVGHEVSQWTCSHTRTRNLHFPATAWAYRVVAAPSRDALANGQGKSFVLPRVIEQLWGRNQSNLSDTASVALGHANCFGSTFDWSGGTVFATVSALLPDGSEQPVTSTPLEISPP